MKIAVIGYSASGKSTLAARLGEMTGCPVLFLDKVQFLPGWQERDRAEARGMVEDFLNENRERGWVIDGNYANFHQERRMAEADLIFHAGSACLRRCTGTGNIKAAPGRASPRAATRKWIWNFCCGFCGTGGAGSAGSSSGI